jgi:hypothetical protein
MPTIIPRSPGKHALISYPARGRVRRRCGLLIGLGRYSMRIACLVAPGMLGSGRLMQGSDLL